MTSGQLTYAQEHAYSFAPVVQREPAIESESRAFEAWYDFWSSNAGYSNTYLELFKNEYYAWSETHETDNSPTSHLCVDL